MIEMRLIVHSDRCTGCRICEQWCSWEHQGAVNPALARLHVLRQADGAHRVLACDHCPDPACMLACAVEAISRHPQTGGLLLDGDLCLACQACAEACINGSLWLEPESGYPLLCDLCGGDPACAKHCPESAILVLR